MVEFRDVVKKYTDPGEALGRDPDTGDVTGLEPGTDVDPVEVVTDPAALAALSGAFVQPGDDAADLGSGTAPDGYVLTADGAGGVAWEEASGGGGGGGGDVASVNGKTGVVVLNYSDVGAASAAQGQLADTAVQPGALAAVATSGAYTDLTETPALGTAAAANTGDFATAAQGAKADTAVQPADLASGLAGTIRHVRWTGSAWPARPPDAEFVIFVSTHDPAAVAPTDINLAQGDYWLRAPGVG